VVKAVRLHAFGPPENLVLEEVPDLQPGSGRVRIGVEASGVHLLDTMLRRGAAKRERAAAGAADRAGS
jgi:NADPH2:quinone reductase